MARHFEVAFLGGNYRSAIGRTHQIAIEMDRCFKLVAGCFSRHDDANRESAEAYGVEPSRTYCTLEQMLAAEPGLDAILVLTPTDQHRNDVVRCLEAGVPVICEKALASSVEDTQLIKAALERHRGFLAVTYNYSGYPMLRELKTVIELGQLGRIRQIQAEMPQEGFMALDAAGAARVPQEWRLRDGAIPTLSLDLGTHLHSLVHFLTGQSPRSLVAQSSSLGNFPVVDTVSSLIRYTGDMDCTLWYSKAALGQRNGLKLRVYGDQGAAEWLQENPEVLIRADNRGNRQIVDRASADVSEANRLRYGRFKAGHPAGFIEAFANYYQDVAHALGDHLDGGSSRFAYVFGIKEACEGIALFDAVARSSRQRCWVDLA